MSEEKKPEVQETPKQTELPKKKKHTTSVITYIAILFAVAFLLLLLSYFMQQRNTAQMIEGLQQSNTAMQNIETLQERNIELDKQVDALTAQVKDYQAQVETLTEESAEKDAALTVAKQETAALNQFWKLVQAYQNKSYSTCKTLIEEMETGALAQHLPNDENGAAEQYQAMKAAVEKR